MVFVGGSRGTSPSLDLTCLPLVRKGYSGNGKGEGRERGKGRVGETTCLTSPTGFCLKYHPGSVLNFYQCVKHLPALLAKKFQLLKPIYKKKITSNNAALFARRGTPRRRLERREPRRPLETRTRPLRERRVERNPERRNNSAHRLSDRSP